MKDVVLIYDIPRESHAVAVKVLRDLKKAGAKMMHHSTWKSSNLKGLVKIAMYIKKNGGHASILEERFLF